MNENNVKPTIVIISSVLPFPGNAGQQQRVYYKLRALRNDFQILFLTIAPHNQKSRIRKKLLEFCDEAVVLSSKYSKTQFHKFLFKITGTVYAFLTGLKFSNYILSEIEFTRRRVQEVLDRKYFDCVLFEYWHAVKCTKYFRSLGIPTILDMHNILWRSYIEYLKGKKWVLPFWKSWALERYMVREENAWHEFDYLIAINTFEKEHVDSILKRPDSVWHIPMGIDLSLWPYCWHPAKPVRVAYYGNLGNTVRQREAMRCYKSIMPKVWQSFPEAEFWIVGSDPPEDIKKLEIDKRVKVTGFVKNVKTVLKTMTTVLCPFSGKFGFRSRLIETMALGVPVVATKEAVYGMGLNSGDGIFLSDRDDKLAEACQDLFRDRDFALKQSKFARRQIEEKFSFEATYGKLSGAILEIIEKNESSSGVSQRMLG